MLKGDSMVCIYIWGIKELKSHHKFQRELAIHIKLHYQAMALSLGMRLTSEGNTSFVEDGNEFQHFF